MTLFDTLEIVFHILVFLATCFGNCLVCIAICRVRALRTVSNIILFSLALADLLMAPVFIFRVIVLFEKKDEDNIACHAMSEAAFTTICVIILHLTAVSIDRFIAIKFPLRYKTITTRRRMKIAVIAIWLLAITGTIVFPHSLPTSEYEDFVDYYDTFHFCLPYKNHDHRFENTSKVFAALIIALFLILPIIVTLGSYMYIIKVSCDQRGKLENVAHLERRAVRKLEIKAAATYGIVIGGFMFCFFPLLVGTLYQQFELEKRKDMKLIMQILSTVASLCACINPAVYAWRSKEFRKAFKKIIRRTQ